ncbi:hydrogenase nickel incorporation protein HypB [Stieleria varia]|uniref:Hydrogenase isoenzymes nickel incorporation protein HypB n=1 Tax=Stieleria varia TaxID=2528005 RepID=A0A5C5ZUS4_9BACT|nr:hydrogenase nickel incorporation protein HypB [Stieleria varia]TWT91272.1 Hydrogenase isoenzymes nickel incorporation protein HypB [Stieleria varia]
MAETIVRVNRDVQADKRAAAQTLREEMTRRGTFVVNLVSSPGAGKTSLLEATCRHWGSRFKMAVLVGDLATDRDAQRLAPLVPVEQLTTGGACHLELSLVKRGLAMLPQINFDFLFIENIGNLVCPASHDLGEHLRVVVLSTTEGDDKPGKYPKMFRTSQLMVLTKTDLLPYVPFCVDNATEDARRIQGDVDVLQVCSIHDDGIDAWCEYLQRSRREMLERLS